MFVGPVDRVQDPDKKAWANYILYDHDRFYALFGTGIPTAENPNADPIALDVAQSFDGVHWEFISRNTVPVKGAHAGFGIRKIDGYFYYYPTCSGTEKGVCFKVFRTRDFVQWEYMGEACDVYPDRRLYHERWDEVHVIEEQEDGKTVYYGYISSETKEDVGEPGAGMVKSFDGIHWEVLPPVEIQWGQTPSQHMELNFVEKIDGRYYLSMSGRMYLDSYGYSLYTFVGDSPFGPFTPDLEMFRLSGNSRSDITWLGHTIQISDGFLVALWLSHDKDPDIPSKSFAIGCLKRLLCQNDHLRLAYWEGNEAAKERQIPLSMENLTFAHPHQAVKSPRDEITGIKTDGIEISASRDGVIILLDKRFDRKKGFILEGSLKARENRSHIATHQHAAGAGFYFESKNGQGTAMIADTLGVTRAGALTYSDKSITEYNIYAKAGSGLVQARSERLGGSLLFEFDDTVGPLGHASFCGIRHNREHRFRLFARGDYFELYIDDLYVQTYLLPQEMTGRIGLCVFDGICSFDGLKAWDMSFPEE